MIATLASKSNVIYYLKAAVRRRWGGGRVPQCVCVCRGRISQSKGPACIMNTLVCEGYSFSCGQASTLTPSAKANTHVLLRWKKAGGIRPRARRADDDRLNAVQ
jgi:hypothetical protein